LSSFFTYLALAAVVLVLFNVLIVVLFAAANRFRRDDDPGS